MWLAGNLSGSDAPFREQLWRVFYVPADAEPDANSAATDAPRSALGEEAQRVGMLGVMPPREAP
jgi:hypothetical protein